MATVPASKVSICDVIEGFHAVDPEDGDKIYAVLDDALASGQRVELSFSGLEFVLTAFLNAAIGRLFAKYTEEQVRSGIIFADATESNQMLVERVIRNAVNFYANAKNA